MATLAILAMGNQQCHYLLSS